MTGPRRTAPPTRRAHGTGSVTSYATKSGTRWRFEIAVPVDPARPEDGERKLSRGGFTTYDQAEAELMLLRADVIRGVPQAIGRDTFAAYAQRWVDGYGGSNGTRMYIQRTSTPWPLYRSPSAGRHPATDLAAAYRGLENGHEGEAVPEAADVRAWPPRPSPATPTGSTPSSWPLSMKGLIVEEPGQLEARRPTQGREGEKGQALHHLERRAADPVLRLGARRGRAVGARLRAAVPDRAALRRDPGAAVGRPRLQQERDADRASAALRRDPAAHRAVRDRPGQRWAAADRHLRQDLRHAPPGLAKEPPTLLAGVGGNVTPLCGLRSADPVFPSHPAVPRPSPGFMPRSSGSRGTTGRPSRPGSAAADRARAPAHACFAAVRAGQSVKVVQERLGHASAQVTLNTYAHLLHDAQSRAAAALDDLLGAGGPPPPSANSR